MKKLTGLVLASITVMALLTGCSTTAEDMSQSDDGVHGNHSETMEAMENMDESEAMFAAMMIPHHQQAIVMSEIALARSSNPEVLALAREIISAQFDEISLMENWVEDSDKAEHGNHVMAGMATEEELAELDSLSSPEFDSLFLTLMIAHHEGALDMVSMLDGTQNADAKQLAADIVRVQQQEIALMQELLKSLDR